MYKEIIDGIDLLLVPLYLILFVFILRIIRKKNKDNPLIRKYLIKGFLFKAACAIFMDYCSIITMVMATA